MGRAARIGAVGTLALFALPLLLAKPPAAAPEASAYFTVEELARASAYHGARTPLALAAWGLGLAVAIILAGGPAGRRLGAWVSARCGGRWLRTGIVLAGIASILPAISVLPLTWLRHRHDRAYGLALDSSLSAMLDVTKAIGLALVLAVVAAVGFLAMVRLAPRRWPIVVGASSSIMLVVLVAVFPVIYEPLFNRFEPVRGPTAERIIALGDRVGVPIREVLAVDASRRTSRHNAYVSGLGSTRRVVLYDTLLAGAPAAEVDLVVAHELAHVRHDDVRNGTLLGVAGILGGIAVLWWLVRIPAFLVWTGASSVRDPRIIPCIAAFVAVAGTATLPVQNLASRHAEARADRTALEITSATDVAISLEQRLARTNLADPTPPRLLHLVFGTHPTTMERIGIALEANR